MKKLRKTNFIQFRVNDKDYLFLQTLKDNNISMTDYITTCIKSTQRYRKFNKVLEC